MNKRSFPEFDHLPPEPPTDDPLVDGWISIQVAVKKFEYKVSYLRWLCNHKKINCSKERGTEENPAALWYIWGPDLVRHYKSSDRRPYNKNLGNT